MTEVPEHVNEAWDVPCPDKDCKGILLQSAHTGVEQCNKCGQLWVDVSGYFTKFPEE